MRQIHLYCPCGHSARIPCGEAMPLRHEIIPRARCKACGRKGVADLRIVWVLDNWPPNTCEACNE